MKKFPFLILSLAVIIINSNSFAQTDSIKTYYFNTIDVKQTKYEAALEKVSMTARKFMTENISLSSNNSLMSTLSSKVPSLFITERGFAGFGISNPAGRISMRGLNGIQQVLVVVDDVPQLANLFGHPINDLHNSSSVSDLVVLSGPSSLMYGSNAMGGIIKMNSHQFVNKGISIALKLNYGSYDTKLTSVSAGYVTAQHNLQGGVNIFNSANDRPNSSYSSKDGNVKYSYAVNDNWKVQLTSSVSRIKSYNPGTVAKPNLNNSVWTDVTRTSSSVFVKNKFDNYEGYANIYFNNGVHDVYDGFHSNDNLLGASLVQGISLNENTIVTVGADVKAFGGMARTARVLADTSVTELGTFATIGYMFNEKLNVNAGFRLTQHSTFGFKVTPQAKIFYSPIQSTNISFGVSQGYRNPTIAELYLFGANINLKPEQLVNYEVGLSQSLLNEKLKFNLNYFVLSGKDFIVMTGRFPNLLNQNLGTIKNSGFEFDSKYSITKNISVNAVYSYLKMEKVIIGSPEQQFSTELLFKEKSYELAMSLKGVNDLYTFYDASKNISRKQSYAIINASGSYNVLQNLSASLMCENIFDRAYEIVDGYPMPGRTFMFSVKYNFNMN